jgi:hypothetical protein
VLGPSWCSARTPPSPRGGTRRSGRGAQPGAKHPRRSRRTIAPVVVPSASSTPASSSARLVTPAVARAEADRSEVRGRSVDGGHPQVPVATRHPHRGLGYRQRVDRGPATRCGHDREGLGVVDHLHLTAGLEGEIVAVDIGDRVVWPIELDRRAPRRVREALDRAGRPIDRGQAEGVPGRDHGAGGDRAVEPAADSPRARQRRRGPALDGVGLQAQGVIVGAGDDPRTPRQRESLDHAGVGRGSDRGDHAARVGVLAVPERQRGGQLGLGVATGGEGGDRAGRQRAGQRGLGARQLGPGRALGGDRPHPLPLGAVGGNGQGRAAGDKRSAHERQRPAPRDHEAPRELPRRVAVGRDPTTVAEGLEIEGQGLGVGVAGGRIDRQGPLEDRPQLGRGLGGPGRGGQRTVGQGGEHLEALAGAAPAPGDQLVADRAQGPDIGGDRAATAGRRLGREVRQRADRGGVGGDRLIEGLGQAPVDDLGLAELADHDVSRLEIAVDDAVAMGVADRVARRDVRAEPAEAGLGRGGGVVGAEELAAADQAHRVEQPAIGGAAGVVDRHDARGDRGAR